MSTNQIKKNNVNKEIKEMDTEIKNTNEQKLETETTVSKKERTKKDTAKLVKCPCCGKMVNPKELHYAEPFYDKDLCIECLTTCVVPYRFAYDALQKGKYVDRLTKKTIPLYLSRSVDYLLECSTDLFWSLALVLTKFLCYDFFDLSNDEKQEVYTSINSSDKDIIVNYHHGQWDFVIKTDKNRLSTSIYFLDEYQKSQEYEKNPY